MDSEPVVFFEVVRVMLHVPFCNMSSIVIGNIQVTDYTQGRDAEQVARHIEEIVLRFDIRIMGGKFDEHLEHLIDALRVSGILVNIAAWMPFRAIEDGEETLWVHNSNILIFGPVQDCWTVVRMDQLMN